VQIAVSSNCHPIQCKMSLKKFGLNAGIGRRFTTGHLIWSASEEKQR
jgi:hypothetical protein